MLSHVTCIYIYTSFNHLISIAHSREIHLIVKIQWPTPLNNYKTWKQCFCWGSLRKLTSLDLGASSPPSSKMLAMQRQLSEPVKKMSQTIFSSIKQYSTPWHAVTIGSTRISMTESRFHDANNEKYKIWGFWNKH